MCVCVCVCARVRACVRACDHGSKAEVWWEVVVGLVHATYFFNSVCNLG